MSPRFKVLCILAAIGSASGSQAQVAPATVVQPKLPMAPPIKAPISLALLKMDEKEFIAQHGGLSRLNLKMQNASAQQIAAEVQRQTAAEVQRPTGFETLPVAKLQGEGANRERFWVEASGQPFWQAIATWNRGASKLSAQASYHAGHMSRLELLSGYPQFGHGPAQMVGPCYLMANVANAAEAYGEHRRRELLIPLTILPDRKFLPFIAGVLIETDEAIDDRGRTIAVTADQMDGHRSVSYGGGGDDYTAILRFDLPDGNARLLRSVKGRLRLAVASRSERWEINLQQTPTAEKTFQGDSFSVTYRFDGIVQNADPRDGETANFRIRRSLQGEQLARFFKLREDSEESLSLPDTRELMHSVRVLDALGNQLSSSSGQQQFGVEDGTRIINMQLRISRDPNAQKRKQSAPAKIVVDVPLEYREVQIPFEFTDLALRLR